MIRVKGQAVSRMMMPEPTAVARQPKVSSEYTVIGTRMPPKEKPNCDSARALARCRVNQLTSATVTDRNPPRLVPKAMKKK